MVSRSKKEASSESFVTIRRVLFALLFLTATSLFVPNGWSHPPSSRSVECMALAMYWEARGEGTLGMMAVGSVVLNRAWHPKFPSSICGVVFQGGETPPCQFSWWCDGKNDRPQNRVQWRSALTLSAVVLARRVKDPTRGALFYHSTSISSSWHSQRQRTTRIGNHVFYR